MDSPTSLPCIVQQPDVFRSDIAALRCDPGQAEGTPVNVLSIRRCNQTEYLRPESLLVTLDKGGHIDRPVLYAAVREGDSVVAVFVPNPAGHGGTLFHAEAVALGFNERGMTEMYSGCDPIADVPPTGDGLPWPQRPATFLLPPP